MDISVEQVLEAASKGGDVGSIDNKNQVLNIFSVLNACSLDPRKIKFAISEIEKTLNVCLKIVYGGKGCTRFTFTITGECTDPNKLLELIRSNKKLVKALNDANFTFASAKGRQQSLAYIEEKKMKSNETKESGVIINNIVGNSDLKNVQVNTENSTISISDNNIVKNYLSKAKGLLANDSKLSEEEKILASMDFDNLEHELEQVKPRAEVVNSLLNSLGSISSIASIIDRIYPYLPVLAAGASVAAGGG